MYSYVIRMSLRHTLMSSVCHSYILMPSVCHSYVLVCHPYATRMSSVCHSHVLVFHPYVTRIYSYIIGMSLVCTCMSFVCNLMSPVCHSYLVSPWTIWKKKKTFLQWRTTKVAEMKGIVILLKVHEMYNILKSVLATV